MSARGATVPVLTSLVMLASVTAACGGQRDTTIEHDDEAGAGVDAAADDDDALPPGVAYVSGGIPCCEEGIGRQCCVPGKPCGQYGGTGHCTRGGGEISGKAICALCCDGLTPISRAHLVDGKCLDDRGTDVLSCAACGDGVCSAADGENTCNCPADCS